MFLVSEPHVFVLGLDQMTKMKLDEFAQRKAKKSSVRAQKTLATWRGDR
jgi:hypothetical protein